MYTVHYISCHCTTKGHSHIQHTLNAYNLLIPPPHSAHSSSFFAFWRRTFKRESTELKQNDHDSSELSESKDDKLSDQQSIGAAEPTETSSYTLVNLIMYLIKGCLTLCTITCWGRAHSVQLCLTLNNSSRYNIWHFCKHRDQPVLSKRCTVTWSLVLASVCALICLWNDVFNLLVLINGWQGLEQWTGELDESFARISWRRMWNILCEHQETCSQGTFPGGMVFLTLTDSLIMLTIMIVLCKHS